MPYRLHISEDDVRDELRRLGYGEVPQDFVVSFRADLLRLIQADIKQLKKQRHARTTTPGVGAGGVASTSTSSSRTHSSSSTASSATPDDGSSSSGRGGVRPPLSRAHSQPSLQSASYTSSFESSLATSASSLPSSAHGLYRHSGGRMYRPGQRPPPPLSPRSEEGGDVGKEEEDESGYSDTGSTEASDGRSRSVSRTSSAASSSGVSSASSGDREAAPAAAGETRQRDKPKRAPSLPPYPRRPDPVSLYHYYRAHWEQHPPPGEDPRSELRWRVRAQLFYSK